MIIHVQIERNPTESWAGYFQVESTDDIWLKGSAFKTYDMKAAHADGYFVISFQHATNEYPKLHLTNRVLWLTNEDMENMIKLEAGTPLLEAVAQKLLESPKESLYTPGIWKNRDLNTPERNEDFND